jgi:hypothetical protein
VLQLTLEQERRVQLLLSGEGSAVQIERAFSPKLANALGNWARMHPRRSNATLLASGSVFSSSMDQLGYRGQSFIMWWNWRIRLKRPQVWNAWQEIFRMNFGTSVPRSYLQYFNCLSTLIDLGRMAR